MDVVSVFASILYILSVFLANKRTYKAHTNPLFTIEEQKTEITFYISIGYYFCTENKFFLCPMGLNQQLPVLTHGL